jgi:hypothetical protein
MDGEVVLAEGQELFDAMKYVALLTAILGIVKWVLNSMNQHVANMADHMDRLRRAFTVNSNMLAKNMENLGVEVKAVKTRLYKHLDTDEVRTVRVEARVAAIEQTIETEET